MQPAKSNRPAIPWIDPPNSIPRKLVIPFKPFNVNIERFPLKRRLEIQQLPPFDTLPRILIPSSKIELKPPVLHCGWVVNQAKLFQHAKELNLPVLCNSRTHMKDADKDYDDDAGFDTDDSEEEVTARNLDPDEDRVGYFVLLQETVELLAEELQLSWPPGLLSILSPLNAGSPVILSLFTNYDLALAPSFKSVEALRAWFGETEQPKWYLDQTNYKWRPGDGRRW
ncbi:hypothetical protein SCP_0114910 [Sparassis crispa]|uniref:Uncharacterized protein n=1 Tax=Sparassis crispa TaxID=139825 RepID=A0A401G8W4_9APHY|nr:hypothetical protein SCP_0114910 [Sparassis crispa]GBE78602.1 hypothetical protein SCP_0114910 [Sparassis crispa]